MVCVRILSLLYVDHFSRKQRPRGLVGQDTLPSKHVSNLSQTRVITVPTLVNILLHLCRFLHEMPVWNITIRDSYLPTYSMMQSPSCAAKWFAASQEIPRISRNAQVHYRTHKRPPPVKKFQSKHSACECLVT